MISAKEFVTRKIEKLNEAILNQQKSLVSTTSSAIFNGFSDYKKYGYINFGYFKQSINELKNKFNSSDIQAAAPYLLEAIDSVANPNGWQFDNDTNSIKPIKNFVSLDKTDLPTPNDFEDKIFVETARAVYNAFICGVQSLDYVIDKGYATFQKYGYIYFTHMNSTNFFKELHNLNDEELKEVVWNALKEKLHRNGWQITRDEDEHDYITYKITPIS